MKFEEALKAMREGKKIKRAEWEKKYIVKDESLRIGVANSETGNMLGLEAILAGSDVLADDWEIYEDKSKPINKVEIFLNSPFQKSNDNLAVIIDGIKIKSPMNIRVADVGMSLKLIQLDFLVDKEDVKEHYYI